MQWSWTFVRSSDEGNDGSALEPEPFPRNLTQNVALGLLWQEWQSRDTTGHIDNQAVALRHLLTGCDPKFLLLWSLTSPF
jgi:hypothetical protein